MRLLDFSFDEKLKLRLPNWPKGDYIKYKKVDKESYILAYWKSAKMNLMNDFELSIEELLSENWVKID